MLIPRWVVFVLAAWVLIFGAYRLSIAFRRRKLRDGDSPEPKRRGLWGQSNRRHILFGLLYLVMGGYLVAMGFGYALNLRSLF